MATDPLDVRSVLAAGAALAFVLPNVVIYPHSWDIVKLYTAASSEQVMATRRPPGATRGAAPSSSRRAWLDRRPISLSTADSSIPTLEGLSCVISDSVRLYSRMTAGMVGGVVLSAGAFVALCWALVVYDRT